MQTVAALALYAVLILVGLYRTEARSRVSHKLPVKIGERAGTYARPSYLSLVFVLLLAPIFWLSLIALETRLIPYLWPHAYCEDEHLLVWLRCGFDVPVDVKRLSAILATLFLCVMLAGSLLAFLRRTVVTPAALVLLALVAGAALLDFVVGSGRLAGEVNLQALFATFCVVQFSVFVSQMIAFALAGTRPAAWAKVAMVHLAVTVLQLSAFEILHTLLPTLLPAMAVLATMVLLVIPTISASGLIIASAFPSTANHPYGSHDTQS